MPTHQAQRRMALHALIAGIGLVLVYLLSFDLQRHVYLLIMHMTESADWSVHGTNESIDRRLIAQYSGRESQWRVSYAGGGANPFDLGESTQLQTIRTLGQSSVADANILKLNSFDLVASYESLVDKAKGDTSVDQSRLARARVNVATFRNPHAPGSESFPVLTLPAADSLLEQTGRCRALIQELGAATPPTRTYVATATLTPELRTVTLARPWIDETILDQASASRVDEVQALFKRNSALNLVPTYLWVVLPEKVRIRFDSEEQETIAASLLSSGKCCNVVCETGSFDIDPRTVKPRTSLEFDGTRGGVPPYLYAVISKRRDLRGPNHDE